MGDAPYREIVADLQHGRRAGVVRLMACYQQRLLAEAVQVFHVPRADAEEIVDDVLLSVVQQIAQFQFRRGDGDFHVWVIAVFRNRVRDFARRRAMLGEPPLPFDEADLLEEEGASTEGARGVVQEILRSYADEAVRGGAEEESAVLGIVREVLEGMESWERVLLRCRALGVPYEEIAGYTGKRADTLRVYHERTRRKFAAMVQTRLQGVT